MKNILESAIQYISPSWARRRSENRARAALYDSVYRAGSYTSRKMRKKTKPLASPNIGQGEKDTIQARCQDAYNNEALARASVTRSRQNAVGKGIRPQSKIDWKHLRIKEEKAAEIEKQIEDEFGYWAESVESDIEREVNFYGLQNIVGLNMLVAGDILVNTPFLLRPGCEYGLKVQLIDSARLRNRDHVMDTRQLRSGVETDSLGAPYRYHVLRSHPNDYVVDSAIDQWDILRAFGPKTGRRKAWLVREKEKPGEKRSVSFLAPILEKLTDLDRYSEAELTAAYIAGCQTINIISESASGFGSYDTPTDAETERGEISIAPGAINNLLPGEDVKPFTPSRPNAQYEPFVAAVMKEIGAALGMSVDFILMHHPASYSAARAAILQSWRTILQHRQIIIDHFCRPVYALFLDEMVASGRLLLPKRLDYSNPRVRYAISRATWEGPSMGSIDPLKTANAAAKFIETGISTRQMEAEKLGNGDVRDITHQLGIEEALRENAGLTQSSTTEEKQETEEKKESGESSI